MSSVASPVAWPAWESPAFYTQDPDVMLASMAAQRQGAPVYWYDAPGYPVGFWCLSKWEDIRSIGSRPELFSNRFGFAVGDASDPDKVVAQLPEWAQKELERPGLTHAQRRGLIAQGKLSLGDPELRNMMLMDPPRHGQVRSIFMKALRPSLVRSLKPRIAELTDEFLDEYIEPGKEVDFVTTVGRIPTALMTELIGVPPEMRERFIELVGAHLQAITVYANKDQAEIDRVEKLVKELRVYCDDLLAERRASAAEGGEDLVSHVARAELDGQPISRGMAFVFITHFITAGETTRALLSHVVHALAKHPDQRALLVERPELIPNCIEETLRYYPINWSGCRTAMEDVEVAGVQIKKDDYVLMAYPSGNRDEDIWERPDEYDITRTFDKDQMGFGHGEHSCPGALLARTDARVIIERLITRLPNWEFAGESVRWSNPFLAGMTTLPVRFFTS